MWRQDRETGDLIIDGFEQGVAPSPHKGIANMQNVNISTEIGEVMHSFGRVQQTVGAVSQNGTLTASVGDGTTVLASDITLAVGQWINVSAATVQIPKTSETVSFLNVGGGGGGGPAINNSTRAGGGGGGGQVASGSLTVSATQAYTVTVGTGGAGGTASNKGTSGNPSVIAHTTTASSITDSTVTGGGGGGASDTNITGADGASGGGGGGNNASGAAGGTGTGGSNGGHGAAGAGGGGGGMTAVGADAGVNAGGNGGSGTSSSISGAAVSYGGGGGGGGNSSHGTGSGGGGNGADPSNAGSNGTANRGGGGGGGCSNAGGAKAGGNGGDGVVVFSYPTGNITATGGTITTSGGNTIHTFTTSGTFTVTAINTTQNLPAGNYFIDYASGSKVKISYLFDPTGTVPIVHGTTGTITFSTLGTLGRPVAKATENYSDGTTLQNRYYILDSLAQVWVYDTALFTSIGLGWYLFDPSTSYYTGTAPSGIGVISGWVFVFSGNKAYTKSVINNATWTVVPGSGVMSPSITTNPHFVLSSHAGSLYYTDGRYIGSITPDTSIQITVNIQSLCSFTAVTTTGSITDVLTGSLPALSDSSGVIKRVPVVLFASGSGNVATAITPSVVYWAQCNFSNTFSIYGVSETTTLTLTSVLSGTEMSATLTSAWTGATMFQNVEFSNGDFKTVQFTNGSTTITWSTALSGAANDSIVLGASPIDIQTGSSGTQYFNTFYPLGSDSSAFGDTPTMTISAQRVSLPEFETAKCLVEAGTNVLIGCGGNVVYPWNQTDIFVSSYIFLPESNVQSMVTVNQMAYIFAGNKGNIYITDGSSASLVLKVPDYCAGIAGTASSYVEPYFTWGDSMYVRGKVYFSILDQTSTKAGNCGGVWSFTPTQNLYIGNDIGIALHLENQNSYGTYNGVATVLLPAVDQAHISPQYWAGWYSSISAPTYGIDFTNTVPVTTAVIDTDIIPTGTMLKKETFKQIEYKLATPLANGESVAIAWRQNRTDSFTSAGTVNAESSSLSGYFSANFERGQWLQLRITSTSLASASGTFVPLEEIRLRQ